MDRRALGSLALFGVAALSLGSCHRDAGLQNAGADGGSAGADAGPGTPVLWLVLGGDLPASVATRVTELVTAASPLSVVNGTAGTLPTQLAPGSWVVSFGSTAATQSVISSADLSALGAEGFIVRSGTVGAANLIATDGNGPAAGIANHGNLGAAYGAYALLEELGFAFLHPLAPTLPATLTFPGASVDRVEAPAWRIRGTHLHTVHPLELTDLLQGWGPGGPGDDAGWSAMLPDWQHFLEWALANRENRVEWVILYADAWKDFAGGAERQGRFAQLVEMAHQYGLSMGADLSIALTQQNGFDMVRNPGTLPSEVAQIDGQLDWVLAAGFDFISTESGSTEFTHPDSARMLAWMNEVATYSASQHGVPAYIKAHCSTGQTAPGYPDPSDSGQDINFNFLPYYAVPQLGVMPHTVEDYGFDDPAPTYGNTNFGYMRDFLEEEVGAREVVWHPETAYWVSFDVNVPLFLPIYAERRLSDLRSLAADEAAGKMGRGAHAGGKMDGQMFFSSGWEWGYWLNDVIAARAAWNPQPAALSEHDAFLAALAPVVRPFGPVSAEVAQLISDTADAEHALLILGDVQGVPPASIDELNGQAYLQGYTALIDLDSLAVGFNIPGAQMTQPGKLGLVDLRDPLHAGPSYPAAIAPLLTQMEATFAQLSERAAALSPQVPVEAAPLFADFADGLRVTALRAQQIHGLYDYVNGFPIAADATRLARLATARKALDTAQLVVQGREAHYRVDPARIAAWRSGPTAYLYGYLWTAHSLFFWWRDEGKAVDAPANPCYLNIDDTVNVGLGDGVLANVADYVAQLLPDAGSECLLAPSSEPMFPQDNLRSRP